MSEPLIESPDCIEAIAEQRSGPGIIVLTSSMQLLHMNRQAAELCRQINSAENTTDGNAKPAHGVLPTALTELCAEIVRSLRVRTEAKDWEQFELKRLAGPVEQQVLLRGFGLPDRGGIQQARLVIILEEVGRRHNVRTAQAKERFQLTNREQTVVEHLAKGWTNKEIANALQITEQTVKEHIKNIMRKTNATTRTGILAQIFKA